MQYSRRRFLKHAIGTTAACGLAQFSSANADVSANEVTDTHIYLGRWPHQRLPNDDPADLVATLRRNNVGQAWVGSFDGLFHKDIAGVNQQLAETCARLGKGMLVPFGSINPTLPDWEEDVRRCNETFHMPGIRLHPNYHGYTLDDPRFARLLELAATGNLIVQLVAWMDDERQVLLNPRPAQVDLKPLAEKIASLQGLKLLVANGYRATDEDAPGTLLSTKQVYFDFARTDRAAEINRLVEKISADRVIFGSCMPLHRVETAYSKMREARLTDEERQTIAYKNASQLIATRVSTR